MAKKRKLYDYEEWVWFEDSAHSPIKEEPEKWGAEVRKFLDSLNLK